jgi:hypothetical protein
VTRVSVEAPTIPFPGESTQAEFYLSAAQHVRGGYPVGGSNLSAAVAGLLDNVAVALTKDATTFPAATGPDRTEDHEALAALIKDAYYAARDNGGTMHTAADDAARAILGAGWKR